MDPLRNQNGAQRQRLYFDLSGIVVSSTNTGIQRVVRHLFHELSQQPQWDVRGFVLLADRTSLVGRDRVYRELLEPYGLHWPPEIQAPADGHATRTKHAAERSKAAIHRWISQTAVPRLRQWMVALAPSARIRHWLMAARTESGSLAYYYAKLLGRMPRSGVKPFCEKVGPGDVFLFADSSWRFAAMGALLSQLKQHGVAINVVVYDAMPLRAPHYFDPANTANFKRWFEGVAASASRVLSISCTEAQQVAAQLQRMGHEKLAQHVAAFPLASMAPTQMDKTCQMVKPLKEKQSQISGPHFLMVGTIDKRKNHAHVLLAFERYIAAGGMGSLTVVGRPGWDTYELQQKLRGPSGIDPPWQWIADADDNVLEACYENADFLIQASYDEGFGLPLIEAVRRNLSVLCSDIPVFHEIMGDAAWGYFQPNSAESIASVLHRAEVGYSQQPSVQGTWPSLAYMTWKKSAARLSDLLVRKI